MWIYESTTHQRSKCPALNRYTTAKTVEVPSSKGVNENESRIMNVTSNRTKASHDHPEPYEVTCSCNVPVDADTQCEITFVAIIDTGSPISLVKRELIPNNINVIKPLDKNCILTCICLMAGGHSVNLCDTENVTMTSLAFNMMCMRVCVCIDR